MLKSKLLWLVMLLPILKVQADTSEEKKSAKAMNSFKPIVIAEIWSTYSYGESKNNETYAPQLDLHFRRLKFGGKGKANDRLSYNFLLHADRLGENTYASSKNSYQGLDLWHAIMCARLSPHSDALNLVAGYYNIAVSRSSYASCKVLGTLDKAQTDWYLRKFLTGKGNGIESGMGIAGYSNLERMHLDYRASVFLPQATQHPNGSSLLYTGRISLNSGKTQTFNYLIKHQNWVKQKSISWALGAAFQQNGYINDTLQFKHSAALGSDMHLHYQGLILEGSLYQLFRNAQNISDFSATLWHVKTLYNFKIKEQHLEACCSYQNYNASGNKSLFKHIGDDTTVDVGINWYINKDKVKMTLHYIHQAGAASMNNGDYMASSLMLIF